MKKHLKKQTILALGSSLALLTFASPIMAQGKGHIQATVAAAMTYTGGTEVKTETPSLLFAGVNYIADADCTRFHYVAARGDEKDRNRLVLPIKADAQIAGASHIYDVETDETNGGMKKLKFDYKEDAATSKMEFWVDLKGDWSKNMTPYESQAKLIKFFDIMMGPGTKLSSTGTTTVTDNENPSASNDNQTQKLSLTNLTDSTLVGKRKIEFELPSGSGEKELEFVSYKISSNSEQAAKRVYHAKIKNKFGPGKHIVELDVPDDQYEIEICTKDKDDRNIVQWRKSSGSVWASVAVPAAVPLEKLIVAQVAVPLQANGDISWQITNPNAADVSFKWSIEGTSQTGSKTLKPGEDYILTVKSGGTNKLTANLDGGLKTELTGNVNFKQMEKLILVPIKTELIGKLMWKVKNPNNVPVTFTWFIEGSDQKGVTSLNAGDELLLAANIGGSNTLVTTLPGGIKTAVPGVSDTSLQTGGTSGTTQGSTAPSAPDTTTPSLTGTATSASTDTIGTAAVTPTSDTTTGAAVIVIPTATTQVIAGTSGSAAPVQTGVTVVAAAGLSDTSNANLQQLPQTGEQAPYRAYAAGSLLVLLGLLFLRKKKMTD
jgi:LPXTG-motif cell wall-anchored protein